jgi:dTDP-glucose 4,6-dehydratase
MIHTSTSEVYGSAQYVPIDEKHPNLGQSPYSASKIGADQLAYSFYASFNLPITTIRPFNTYGPRQSARAIIPTIISQIASGQRELKLGAISPTRDFNFVLDTVQGFISALESKSDLSGEVINIGSGFEISIRDLVALIADVMEVEVAIKTDDKRLRPSLSEVERLCADNSKARELLGWAPSYLGESGLRQGIYETKEWFLNPLNLAKYKPSTYNV